MDSHHTGRSKMSNFLRACGAQPFIRFYVFRGEFVPWYTPGRNKCTFTLLHQIRTKLLRNPHPMDMFNVPCSVGCCLLDMESWNLDRFRSFHLHSSPAFPAPALGRALEARRAFTFLDDGRRGRRRGRSASNRLGVRRQDRPTPSINLYVEPSVELKTG